MEARSILREVKKNEKEQNVKRIHLDRTHDRRCYHWYPGGHRDSTIREFGLQISRGSNEGESRNHSFCAFHLLWRHRRLVSHGSRHSSWNSFAHARWEVLVSH